jgi:hypothetical protein
MKLKLLAVALIAFCFRADAQQIELPLAGNAFSSQTYQSRSIGRNGISRWTDNSEKFTAYFRTTQKGDLSLSLKNVRLDGEAEIAISIKGERKSLKITKSEAEIAVGNWEIKDTGYVAIELSGIKKSGYYFPSIETILLSGKALSGEVVYVKDNTDNLFHFGRRGPSTHLNYELPKNTKMEWFYNEVTIPEGMDPIGSYFMANGFGEGYFGMQVNSATERRVLFSVWSPFHTDNPKEIPDNQRIKLIKKGDDVRGGEFGGEGSGGQSVKIYNWQAGNTYKFLLRVRPVANNYTEYTAYFYAPEQGQWNLIACFERPETTTYARRLHSFLECFSPNMGAVTRQGTFDNQWVCDTNGKWYELNKARFTYDATAAKGYRKDYQGGLYAKGGFYLKIDGFFNDFTTYNTLFERKPNGKSPQIDFSKLP